MKDLDKIKREYEEQLRLAELANDFERVTSIEPNVFHSGDHDFISVKGCDIATIARVLKEYPADAQIVLNASATHIGDKHGMCHLSSRRDYNDNASRLEIEYYNKNVKFWLDININGNDVLEQYQEKGAKAKLGRYGYRLTEDEPWRTIKEGLRSKPNLKRMGLIK